MVIPIDMPLVPLFLEPYRVQNIVLQAWWRHDELDFLGDKCSTPFWSDPIGKSKPVSGCLFNYFYLLFIYLFFFSQKCRDLNPWPNPNGGYEPEPSLLRLFSFILSKHFILSFHFRVFIYTEAFQMVGP